MIGDMQNDSSSSKIGNNSFSKKKKPSLCHNIVLHFDLNETFWKIYEFFNSKFSSTSFQTQSIRNINLGIP